MEQETARSAETARYVIRFEHAAKTRLAPWAASAPGSRPWSRRARPSRRASPSPRTPTRTCWRRTVSTAGRRPCRAPFRKPSGRPRADRARDPGADQGAGRFPCRWRRPSGRATRPCVRGSATTCPSRCAPAPPPRTCRTRASPASRTRTCGSSARTPCSSTCALLGEPVLAPARSPTGRPRDRRRSSSAMAVVVQRMVDAGAAGVAMTLNPANGDRSKIVDRVELRARRDRGVAAASRPDSFLVDKVMLEIVERTIGHKQVELVADSAGAPHGARGRRGARAARRPASRPTRCARSRALAKRAEQHYGCPQDIEWAVDADGDDRVLLLQSRPETVWSVASAEAPEQSQAYATGIARPGGHADQSRWRREKKRRMNPAREDRMTAHAVSRAPTTIGAGGAEGWQELYPYYLPFRDETGRDRGGQVLVRRPRSTGRACSSRSTRSWSSSPASASASTTRATT